jgi:DNA invertase Pin-like site-specific DNA recombinase
MTDTARNRPAGVLPDRESFEGGGEGACYARLSDAKMARESSIGDQLRECREEARRDGNFIPDANLFDDLDVRGATESRPGLDRLLDLVGSGKAMFTDLYMADTSRLARNSSLAPRLRKFFKEHGIRLHFVENGMKSGTSGFDLQHTIQGYVDEQYSEQLGEKISRAQVGLVLKGYLPCGKCYGYRHKNHEHPTRMGKWNRPFVIGVWQVPYQPEVDVILEIFRMYADGEGGYTAIGQKLNERGIDAPGKGSKKEGEGWSDATIRQILKNERYIGRVAFRKTKHQRNSETPRPAAVILTPTRSQHRLDHGPLFVSQFPASCHGASRLSQSSPRIARKLLSGIYETGSSPRGARSEWSGAYSTHEERAAVRRGDPQWANRKNPPREQLRIFSRQRAFRPASDQRLTGGSKASTDGTRLGLANRSRA